MNTQNIVITTLTAKDWKIIGFGLHGITLDDYVNTEGVEDDFEITIEMNLDEFVWGEIDSKIGEANDLGIIELIHYDDKI